MPVYRTTFAEDAPAASVWEALTAAASCNALDRRFRIGQANIDKARVREDVLSKAVEDYAGLC